MPPTQVASTTPSPFPSYGSVGQPGLSASALSSACSWAGVAHGCVDFSSAATAATCGVAIDVPCRKPYELFGRVERMRPFFDGVSGILYLSPPGAATSMTPSP